MFLKSNISDTYHASLAADSPPKSEADKVYLALTAALLGLGFVIQYSASSSLATAQFNDPGHFMRAHLVRILMGLILGGFCFIVNYKYWKQLAIWLLLATNLALIFTLVYNNITGQYTAARWLNLGPLRIQPSEFAKLALIMYLASFLDRHQADLNDIKKGFLPPALLILGTIFLIVIAPDFSTGAVIVGIAVIIMIIGGSRLRHLSIFFVIFAVLSLVTILRSPYKLERIMTLFSPEKDLQGAGYQIHQSLISLGNGGFWGRGLADSVEKNFFLPDSHTDFVFAIAGEEFGFLGVTILLILFLMLLIRGIRIALNAPDLFGRLLGIGISISMFIYVLVNVGVVCGVFPVTGLPLPYLSYGGSTMLYNLIGAGILLNLSRYSSENPPKIRNSGMIIHG